MPSQEKEIGLTLTLKNGGPEYELTQNYGDPTGLPNPENKITLGEKHWYWLNFRLADAHLSFDGNAKSVFRVMAGSDCPARGNASECDNFRKRYFKILNDGTLRVKDNNKNANDFCYRICIRDRNGNPMDFDPVITNGGGGNDDRYIGWVIPTILLGVGLLAGAAYFTGALDRWF